MSIKVSASILSCDFLNLKDQLKSLEHKKIDSFHLDIMDGHFVPNLSFGPHISNCVRNYTSLPLETHLMITNPLNFIDRFSYSDVIFFHIESNDQHLEVINKIRELKVRVGIAINPKTDYSKLIPYMESIDDILVMTVNPGFGGQKFISDQIQKIKKIHEIIQQKHLKINISVDGGVNNDNAKICEKAGVSCLVIGSYLQKNNLKF